MQNFIALNDEQTFIYMLSSEEPSILNLTGKFIFNNILYAADYVQQNL